MTSRFKTFLGIAALCLAILLGAGAALADGRSKVPAPPPPPPPPPRVDAPQQRSDIGQKLQFQLNEANSVFSRSMQTAAPKQPATGLGRGSAMPSR